jgi:hypothetical protein
VSADSKYRTNSLPSSRFTTSLTDAISAWNWASKRSARLGSANSARIASVRRAASNIGSARASV